MMCAAVRVTDMFCVYFLYTYLEECPILLYTSDLQCSGAQSILLKATQRLRRSSSYILFLHFSFAVGATVSPLWARFFVSKETLQIPSNLTCADALLLPLTTDNPVCSLALNTTCPHNSSNVSLSDLEKYLCVSSPHPSLLFGWAYWLCAPIFLKALGAFVYYWIKYEPIGCRRTRSEFPSRGQEGLSTTSVPHKQTGTAYFLSSQPLHIKIIFFLLLSLFCYIYIGIEAFFTNYLFTFSVESGTFAKDTAAILNSLFWATFAVFRFIAILLALMKFPTALQIVANISRGLIMSIVLAIFPREAGVVWGAAALIGVCMSSTFPSIVAWLAQQTEMSGKVSALLICMGTLADMTMPLTVATLMTRVTPFSFVYFTVVEYAASLFLVAILFVFTWSRKRLGMKQQGCDHVGWKGEEEIQLTEAALSDEEEKRGEGREEKELEHAQLPTSDSSEGYSTSELLNGHQIRTKIDALLPSPAHMAQGRQARAATKSQEKEVPERAGKGPQMGSCIGHKSVRVPQLQCEVVFQSHPNHHVRPL
eukprot:Em0001g136a